MRTLTQLVKKLIGREENIFVGIWFLIFHRYYKAPFGKFRVPKSFLKCHFYSRFLNDSYEIEERKLITQHLKPNDHVLELGGCAGIVSCLTSQMIDSGRHCVVEANPYMLPYLYANREANGGKFHILGVAVSKAKTLPFFIHKNMVGSSAQRRTETSHHIACMPLELIEQQYGPFNVLIMDIEGGEADFIAENENSLSGFNKLIIEFHPSILTAETVTQLYTHLDQLGFDCVETIDSVSCFLRR